MASEVHQSITSRRVDFNRALEHADIAAIADVLAERAILITGTDSAVISGRKAQMARWKREFASPDRALYVRATESVRLSPVAPLGFETGSWRGLLVRNRQSFASGTYAAKWRQIDDRWMIEAEIYVTFA